MPLNPATERVWVTNNRPIAVEASPPPSGKSAFGESLVAQLTPFIQATACYNLIPANFTTYTATGGAATATGGEFTCTTGTSVGGYGVVRSIRSVNYKGGMGAVFRGTGRFTAGVANSQQGVGFFNVGDGFLFGYNGASFGIIHQKDGLPEIRTITVTAASSGSTNLTLTLNTAAYTIPLTAGTVQHNANQIAVWLMANQTIWQAYQNDDDVVLMANSDGAKSGTYTYSHATSTGSIAQTTAGVTKTTNFIAQTAWNQNTASWIDPTKGNVYQIQYQYLGYGAIEFSVEDPDTGGFILVHRIKYANANTSTSVSNPALNAGVYAASLGSTTNLTTRMASVGVFVQGTPGRTRNPRAYSFVKSISSTLTNILTLRNRAVYGGKPNKVEVEPILISAFTESAKGITVVAYASATGAGTPNFQDISTGLVTEVDTAGTTISAGTPLLEFVVPANSSAQIDLASLRVRLPPHYSISFGAKVNSGAAADTGISVVFYEDI